MSTQTQPAVRILPRKLLVAFPRYLTRLTSLFISLHIKPNTLSLIALLAGLGAGILFFLEKPLWAGILIVICGLFDILDGKVAVGSNQKSLFGAIFDSTLDRYSEFFIYLGLALHFRNHWALWLTFFTILGSIMVSYTRARAEGLGIECKIGLMQRAERMVFLSLGSIIGAAFQILNSIMIAVLGIIAVISNITAFQRAFYVKRIEKQRKLKKEVKSDG
ncbi:MAG: CDP-alcohol phosphatidyltransferase family protein [Candidatus Aminicenantales bacterium]